MPWRFDHQERALLIQYLPKNGVFVDVGANVGLYACTALSVLESGGKVMAIEPNPPVADRLQFNLESTAQHHKSQAEFNIIRKGVSDHQGEFSLYLNRDNLGASSLRNTSEQSIEISCLPLLNLVQNHELKSIDVMKVDIEGAEDLALVPFLTAAADAMLPKLLIFENNAEDWHLDLFQALNNRDYQLVKKTRMNCIFMRS